MACYTEGHFERDESIMADGMSKIRIKMGSIEVEYEGSDAFLKKELPEILEAVSKLYKESGEGHEGETTPLPPAKPGKKRKISSATTGTIAAKLKVGRGPDLIIAAAAKMTLVDGLNNLARKALHDEMKTASAYYKTSYGSNLSSYITNLVRVARLVESAKDTYALSADEQADLESILSS